MPLPPSSRREFLKFLAASPLFATIGRAADDLIASPQDALNVFDFEAVARRNLPPAHFGYIATGVDSDVTLRANEIGFARYQIRPRRLIDVSTIDTTTRLLGVDWPAPIALAPTGSQRA